MIRGQIWIEKRIAMEEEWEYIKDNLIIAIENNNQKSIRELIEQYRAFRKDNVHQMYNAEKERFDNEISEITSKLSLILIR